MIAAIISNGELGDVRKIKKGCRSLILLYVVMVL